MPPFESTAVQLIGGALASILLMLLFETPHWHWTAHFAAALAWNTLAMSIFGMAIYNLMLDRHGAGRASSGFFVVPGASAVMGFCAAERASVGDGDRGAGRLDHRRRAGVVAPGAELTDALRRRWNFSAACRVR